MEQDWKSVTTSHITDLITMQSGKEASQDEVQAAIDDQTSPRTVEVSSRGDFRLNGLSVHDDGCMHGVSNMVSKDPFMFQTFIISTFFKKYKNLTLQLSRILVHFESILAARSLARSLLYKQA